MTRIILQLLMVVAFVIVMMQMLLFDFDYTTDFEKGQLAGKVLLLTLILIASFFNIKKIVSQYWK